MADNTVRGRFVWHELMTPDAAGAQSFYTKVLGWKTQPWESDPSYVMFVSGSGPLGGTAQSSGEAHWLTYVRTDDIEATVEKARSLGGSVRKQIEEMPNGGKYAVLADPQGAQFGVYWSTSDLPPQSTPKRGEHSWYELATSDYRAAFEFYSELFGWEETGAHDMGEPLGKYFMFGRNGNHMGGMFNRTPDMPGGPGWLAYVRVKDVQQTVKKVKSAGGTLIAGPMEVPGGDWIAQFTDPQGAVFAVHTLAADIKNTAASTPAPAAVQSSEPEQSSAETEAATPQKSAGTKTKTAAKKAKKSGAKSGAKAASKAAAKATGKAPQKSAKKSGKKSGKKSSKQSAPKKGAKARSKAAKRGAVSRGAKRPARKTAAAKKTTAKKATKKRSAGKKRAAKRPRKAK